MACTNLNHPLPCEESMQMVDGEIKGVLPARRLVRGKDAGVHQQVGCGTAEAAGVSSQVEKRAALKPKRGKRSSEKVARLSVQSVGDVEEVGPGSYSSLGYGDFSEDVALIKKDFSTAPAAEPEDPPPAVNRLVSSLIAMLQGVEVLCSLAILYLYKDDFQMDPALMTVVQGALRIPWTVKPLWALMSDGLPLFGYRRKSYILIGSLLCLSSMLCMGLFGYMWLWTTTLLLFSYFLGSALCNVIGEALVVEAGRTDASEDGAAKTVSTFFAFRKLSFAVMSYLSGFLLEVMPKQHLFLVASVMPAGVFLACWFLSEPKIEHRPIGLQVKRLMQVMKQPALLNSMFFIFVMMCTPSAGAVMFYFMTNELKFGPELLGRMALFQSIASLMGILTYMWLFSKTRIRSLLLWSTVLITPFCLLPVIVVERWNLQLGIPDSAFVVTDTVLMEFVGEFQSMPILVLAARLCPPGLESTIYSVLLSAYNLGLGIGSIVSAGMTSLFGITSTTFNNLSIFIGVCAVTNFIPLFLLWLIPSDAPLIDTSMLVAPYAINSADGSSGSEDERARQVEDDDDSTGGDCGSTGEHSTTDSDKEMGGGSGSGGETDSSSGGCGSPSKERHRNRCSGASGAGATRAMAGGGNGDEAEVMESNRAAAITCLPGGTSFSPLDCGRVVPRGVVTDLPVESASPASPRMNADLTLRVGSDTQHRSPFREGGGDMGGGGSGECCGTSSAA